MLFRSVGAFALGGAVVLAGIITFMGAFSFGKKGYELRINYPQVFLAVIGDLEKFWMQTPKTKGRTSLPGQSATIIPSHGENSKGKEK